MHVLVTGSNGFIGKNLIVRLNELNIKVSTFTRKNSTQELENLIKDTDFIVHLAGENRPKNEKNFDTVNNGLTKSICDAVCASNKKTSIIFASSSQVELDNAYGKSKLNAETALKALELVGVPVYVYRLPGVFGKWCKPDYNSVVATFCYNISNNLPVQVNNADFELRLVYIDDVVREFVRIINGVKVEKKELSVQPEYKIKLGKLADQIKIFRDSRKSLITERVGDGLIGKLYSTYLSYFSPKQFSYSIPSYHDDRGVFAEILKTRDSGQFSFFTAKPGVTRGGHYHHSKTEKFLVVQGKAKFGFKHIALDETYEIFINSEDLKIVETVPGWSHDITNVGKKDMIVMLWANEIFDPNNPDTITHKV
ncbi:MAG: NAD-dependent epimerase/dehydratase family protein [Methylophilaceae bacterium]|nr:NAD-dependent epimerase/dehydratase family protein [Methylophilaceae bacterium]